MSRPFISQSSADELRRKFTIWTLAILGSLSGSGAVQLPSTLWAQESPGSSSEDKNKAAETTQASTPKLSRELLNELLVAKKYDEAALKVDDAIAADPSDQNYYLSAILASSMASSKPDDAVARFHSIMSAVEPRLNEPSKGMAVTTYTMCAQSLSSLFLRQEKSNDAIAVLENAIDKTKTISSSSAVTAGLSRSLASALVRAGRIDDAKQALDKQWEKALEAAKAEPNSASRRALVSTYSTYVGVLGDKLPDVAKKLYESIEPMLREVVEAEAATVDDYMTYQSMQSAHINWLSDRDAESAAKLIESTLAIADKLAERVEETDVKRLSALKSSMKSLSTRLESKLLHQRLIGQVAAEFDVDAVVNMPKPTLADLKGKVVLIDFWAVWCGPCIATFPHLQHLHKEYSDKGLVIVGVTKPYGYVWDKDAGKQIANKEATMEQELEMLEEFRKAHKLEHGFVVTPKTSDYSSKFGVYGIPQVVVLDKEGKVQLIRVGSGDQNATDVEDKIKSLLGN